MNAISSSTKESPFLRSLCLAIESPVFLTELFPHLDCYGYCSHPSVRQQFAFSTQLSGLKKLTEIQYL